jgi:hypothetical protein
MRETVATQFQSVYVDDLHGGVDDRTHGGDQSVFTTDVAAGITRGTAIVTAVRDCPLADGHVATVLRRDLRGSAAVKRASLDTFKGAMLDEGMARLSVSKDSRWRLIRDAAGDYPPVDDYLPFYVSGVQPVRDAAVVDFDRTALVERMRMYFDLELVEPYDERADLPALVKLAQKALSLDAASVAPTAKGADSIKRILANLSQVAVGVAELRNEYGTDHGRLRPVRGLGARHAHLAVGCAWTYCRMLLETLSARTQANGSSRGGTGSARPAHLTERLTP